MSWVLEFSSNDYEDLKRETPPRLTLLEIYSPSCPHCQRFAPEYEEVAREAQEQFGDLVHVARLNGRDEIFPRDLSVDFYPSFFLVGPLLDRPVLFTGTRSKRNLLKFLGEYLRITAPTSGRYFR